MGEGELAMKRIKIAVVTDVALPWHIGGSETHFDEKLKCLLDFPVDITVYTMKWWDRPPVVVHGLNGTLEYAAICKRRDLYKNGTRSTKQLVYFSFSCLRLLVRKFDAIDASQVPSTQFIALRIVATLRRVPLFGTWYEVWSDEYWRDYLGPWGRVASRVDAFCSRLPDQVVCFTEGGRSRLISRGVQSQRISVQPIGLDFSKLRSVAARPDSPDLVFVGRLIEHKRPDVAVESLKILFDRGLDLTMGIVGTGPESSAIRLLVSKLGLESRVTFYDFLDSQDEVWSLVKGAKLLVAPSEREGFGLAVAEALALGTPVICVDSTENASRHLVSDGKTGSVVESGSPSAIAAAVERWMHIEIDKKELSEAFCGGHSNSEGRIFAKNFLDLVKRRIYES